MLTQTIRSYPHPRVQRLYQELAGLVARLQANSGQENRALRHAVREFFTDHRKEIWEGLDVFNALSPAARDLTANRGMVNPTWRTWFNEIETTFSQATGDPEAEEEWKKLERAVGPTDVPDGPDVSLLAGGYEAIERALRYAAYWMPDD